MWVRAAPPRSLRVPPAQVNTRLASGARPDATRSRTMVAVTDQPTWTILVPTLGERGQLFARLMDVLLPQLPHDGRVRVLAYWNNGRPRLPEIRQRMVDAVDTEYLCCIDDDDLIPDHYVDSVLTALAARPDYVGWMVQCYENGRPTAISYHDLGNGGWWNEDHAYFRDLSHINPIRTELARLADFRKTQSRWPEDRAWVQQLRSTGRVRQQVYIDRVMYHYLFSTSKTSGIGSRWKMPSLIQRRGYKPAAIDHPYFSYYPGCLDA